MNKLLTEKESFKIGLRPFENSDRHFFHFGNENRVGVNPKYRYSTPIGVYGYMTSDLYPLIDKGKDFFGHKRSLCHVLEVATSKILNLQEFSFIESRRAVIKIYDTYNSDPTVSLSKRLKDLKVSKNQYSVNSQGDLLWKLIYFLVNPYDNKISSDESIPTRRSPILMNKILQEMGYAAVFDNKGAIHNMQTTQMIFLTNDSYKHIKTIEQFNK